MASSSPSSPIPAGLGGEGIRELVDKHASSSEFFPQARSPLPMLPYSSSCQPGRPWRRGVALGLLRSTRVSDGPLWEPLEFWISLTFLPRQRCLATATRGHRNGHAELVALNCKSLLLFMRSFSPASPASKPPVRPSGFVPARTGMVPARLGKPSAASLDPIAWKQSLLGCQL
jgi:hypothetical protein